MLRLLVHLFICAVMVACGAAAPPSVAAGSSEEAQASNSVAAYLSDAEVQAETDAQRAELRAALQDMLSLPAAELRSKRYAAYDGTPGARTLPALLMAHIVPATPQGLDEARFYDDVQAPSARAAIELTLERMRAAASPTSVGTGGAPSAPHD